ncbi:MAG TPA: helix-turn-helix transcriptional regulator [Solirubrobacterales bacterium]|nr:helix-turn-helix transcriptional regulator [Solirubrobacterales bacterium]
MPHGADPQIGLSKAIRQFRKERHLSQESLALTAGLHPTWISHLESGRVNPTWANMRRIAAGLEVPLSMLAARAEELERKFQKIDQKI